MLLPTVLGLGDEGAGALLQGVRELAEHHERDAWESISTAYRAGTYSKVCFTASCPLPLAPPAAG